MSTQKVVSGRFKLGVVSTTIHDESGYLPFDTQAAESPFSQIGFYVAGDLGTPDFDTAKFSSPIVFLSPAEQEQFRCSAEIGWNKIMRRNLALLRCIADQPDFILLIDDDNLPPPDYFRNWYRVLTSEPRCALHSTPAGSGGRTWHNYLRTADTPVEIYPRGFPISERGRWTPELQAMASGTVPPSDVWLYQGISLGDPDVDATTRLAIAPRLQRVDELDYVLRDVWSPYNTQNTIVARQLFPLACVWPHCGRYDDIFASFTWQQFAFSQRKYIHIGNALNHQQHRTRDLLADLRSEIEGMTKASEIVSAIATIEAPDANTFLEALIDLPGPELITRHRRFFEAFRRDLEEVAA